jgi:predicted secreted protein
MSLVSFVAIYFVVWWVVLFAVLPWGIRTQQEEGEVVLGTAHSAPVRASALRIIIVTSIVAAVPVFALWVATARYGFSLVTIADWFYGR